MPRHRQFMCVSTVGGWYGNIFERWGGRRIMHRRKCASKPIPSYTAIIYPPFPTAQHQNLNDQWRKFKRILFIYAVFYRRWRVTSRIEWKPYSISTQTRLKIVFIDEMYLSTLSALLWNLIYMWEWVLRPGMKWKRKRHYLIRRLSEKSCYRQH